MQSALSFAPLRPVSFVNSHGAGQGLRFAGRGSLFFHGAGRSSLNSLTQCKRNKNTKCPIDAHCHRHCRRDPRITKDSIGARTQGLAPHKFPYSLKIFLGFLLASWYSRSSFRSSYFEHGGQEVLRWILAPMQSWISSAMAMAMSIYRTLCVLVIIIFP